VGICEGQEPARGPFVFVVSFAPYDPDNPPTGPDPTLPPPVALPPCPLACTASAETVEPRITIRNVDTPPGDDVLSFRGEMTLAHPFAPALDPVANGVGLLVANAAEGRVLDLVIPGGAWDPDARSGWKPSPGGTKWRYLNKGTAPAGGITRIVIEDLSHRTPGLVRFSVKGRHGSYPVNPADLPLEGFLVVDQPTAESGQCAKLAFDGSSAVCAIDGGTVKCR
jgi:hypothetical protein